MTCTTDWVSPKELEIYWSSDDNTYTSLCGEFASIDNPEQSRISGEAYAFCCDTAYTSIGPREPIDVTFEIVYTEVATEAFTVLEPYFTSGSTVYLKWYPKGSTSGSEYAADGYLTNWVYPGAAADDTTPIMAGGTLRTDEIEMS